ncbi:NAD(P)H-dependent oxidoreductase [Limosilactobacillus difficilis]|uniref:NAD(P)H-dependent oxidoreductase n=1 Tax=Limosilactobacillus difficilis TaxID=2991838 RepID=UPI0024B9CFFE|nr:NAD(P)H-dependent oxidoreductase [Limosilactobacillus difficilis]
MLKLAAVVGTNAHLSYNRKLLYFMKHHFRYAAQLEIVEIKNLPAFAIDAEENTEVWQLKQKLQAADGVVFSTPEYDHAIPSALKNVIEWLTYHCSVLDHKPAMVVGVSYGKQASSRAQVQMRQTLMAPDCNACVLPGNEVLIGNAMKVFDSQGRLTDTDDLANLEKCFMEFVDYATMIKKRTKEDLAMASKKPFVDTAYVNFPTGRMSLTEVQQMLEVMPFDLNFVDAEDTFVWYNHEGHQVNARNVNQLNHPVSDCHPPMAREKAMQVIDSLREGKADYVPRAFVKNGHKIYNLYVAVQDVDGHYLGTLEITQNVDSIIDLYNRGTWGQPTGMISSPSLGGSADAATGASDSSTGASEGGADSSTGASEENSDNAADDAATGASDSSTGASETGTDGDTGASESDGDTGASEGGYVADDDEAAADDAQDDAQLDSDSDHQD